MHNLSNKDLVIASIKSYDDIYSVCCDGDIITVAYDDSSTFTMDYGVMSDTVRKLRASDLQALSDFVFDEFLKKANNRF